MDVLPDPQSERPSLEEPTARVFTVELDESGPGTKSDVRLLGVFSSFERALAFCRSDEGRPYLEHPQYGAITAFGIVERGLDTRAIYQTRYVAFDGSLHRDWPYEGVGAGAALRPADPEAGGLEL